MKINIFELSLKMNTFVLLWKLISLVFLWKLISLDYFKNYLNESQSFLNLVYCDSKFRALAALIRRKTRLRQNKTSWTISKKVKVFSHPRLLLARVWALPCVCMLRRSPASCWGWPAPPWTRWTSTLEGTACTALWSCCTRWQWPRLTRSTRGGSPCPSAPICGCPYVCTIYVTIYSIYFTVYVLTCAKIFFGGTG